VRRRVVLFIAVRRHLVQALACAIHAVLVVVAVAARAKRVLGHGNVIGNYRVVDEAEVWVQNLVLVLVGLLVDDGDGE
jgi:hypothetical protein